jgi:hypothetical protein
MPFIRQFSELQQYMISFMFQENILAIMFGNQTKFHAIKAIKTWSG